jgi:hypothetical protein
VERTCLDCGEEFEVRHGFETRCYPCWLEYKEARGERTPKAAKTKTVYVEVPVPDPRLPDPEEFEAVLRAMIVLCHPDKHGNSRLSHEVK